MEIEKMKFLKVKMEEAIEDLILTFEQGTDLLIDHLDITNDFGQQTHGRVQPDRIGRPFVRTKILL